MKSNLLKVLVIALCLVGIGAGAACAEPAEGRWVLAGFTKYRDGLFVDKGRLAPAADGTVQAWVKVSPWAKSRYLVEIRDYLTASGKNGKAFKTLEFLCEFDCREGRVRFLKFVYLDGQRAVMHTAEEGRPDWLTIAPGNLWGKAAEVACQERR